MRNAADMVHRRIAAFNTEDTKEILTLLNPEVEWVVPGVLLRGPDQVPRSSPLCGGHFPT